jgi:hypothetical protein
MVWFDVFAPPWPWLHSALVSFLTFFVLLECFYARAYQPRRISTSRISRCSRRTAGKSSSLPRRCVSTAADDTVSLDGTLCVNSGMGGVLYLRAFLAYPFDARLASAPV